jgi:hypothetical protein
MARQRIEAGAVDMVWITVSGRRIWPDDEAD